MSDSLNKAKISTPWGLFELEGEKEFVKEQLEKVFEILKSKNGSIVDSQSLNSQNVLESVQNDSVLPTKNSKTRNLAIKKEREPKFIDLNLTIEEEQNLKNFLVAKKPLTHIERFACLVYWLKKEKNILETSIDELWSLYKILSIRPPKAMYQVFRDGKSKKGVFDIGTSVGFYRLTSHGESFVEYDLPPKEMN